MVADFLSQFRPRQRELFQRISRLGIFTQPHARQAPLRAKSVAPGPLYRGGIEVRNVPEDASLALRGQGSDESYACVR